MPLFVQGQDPRDTVATPVAGPLAAPDRPFFAPSVGDAFESAFREDNPVVSVLHALGGQGTAGEYDPAHNPINLIRGTKYEPFASAFIDSPNENATRARMAAIDGQERDRTVLASSGFAGTAASLVAGALDPFLYIPVAGEFRFAGKVGSEALRLAAQGAAGTAVSEAALLSSQPTRTWQESAGNIAANTLMMALLGGAVGALSPAERVAAAANLDAVRPKMAVDPVTGEPVVHVDARLARFDEALAAHPSAGEYIGAEQNPEYLKLKNAYTLDPSVGIEGAQRRVLEQEKALASRPAWDPETSDVLDPDIADELFKEYTKADEEWLAKNGHLFERRPVNDDIAAALPQAVGAAASDPRTLKPVSYGLEKLPVVGEWFKATSPTQRVFWNDTSVTARRAMADLADTALLFEDNARGIATTAGGSIERDSKQAQHRMFLQSSDAMRDAYVAYRYPEGAPSVPMARAAFEDVTGRTPDGRMSYGEFKEAIYDAMYSGDVHPEPAVESMAKELRAKVFTPLEKRAQEAGLLDEGLTAPRGDQSFISRMWNKSALAARRPEAKEIFTGWLEREQAAKAAAQDRIRGFSADMDAMNGRIRDLERKAAQLPEADKARADLEYDIRIAQEQIAERRGRIEKELQDWSGKSSAEAKAALKAREKAETSRQTAMDEGRYKGQGERLTSADSSVDAAVRRILGTDRNLSRADLASRSDEIIDRILGGPDGRLNYDQPNGMPRMGPPRSSDPPMRGSLRSREFAIPTALVREFVERDMEHVLQSHLRTLVPDLLLTERFGDVEMRDVFRRINEEFAAKADALAGKEKDLRALEAERQGVIRDVAAVRDRLRGVYGWTPDASGRQLARVARAASQWNALTSLGTSMLNSMGDLAGAVFRHGIMNVMHDAWLPFFKGMLGASELAPAAKRQARALMIAIESDVNLRHHQLADITEAYRPGSKFERGLQWASNRMQMVNGQGWFTDRVKAMAVTVAQAEILRHAEKVAKGTASDKEIGRLAAASIDRHTAESIWREFEAGGGEVLDGVPLANSLDWSNRAAARAFENALAREADIAVVTPGQEKPLWMSKPVAGLLGQFKSFVAATHERTLIAQLQQRDARTLQGLFAAVATGMLSYRLYTLVSGQPISDKPQEWIKEGINRSGVMGWFDEANANLAKATGGKSDMYRLVGADKELSRFQSRSILSAFGGPTAGKIQDAAAVMRAVVTREGNASDVTSARRLIPFQNLAPIRPLLNQLETGVNNAFGFPVKPPEAH